MIPPPPPAPHATLDFETYSEAGFIWNDVANKYVAPKGAKEKGIRAVGSRVYAEHASTEVLVMRYRLPGGPVQWFVPAWGLPLPVDLFAWIASGGLLEAHNNMFERLIWEFVCRRLYGFPVVPPEQWRCSMATARVNNYPGALDNLGDVLQLNTRKDKEGKRLLDKFSIPRNPTKKDARRRIRPEDEPAEFLRLCEYCGTDVESEGEASDRMTPMTADELAFWQIDQDINWRGVAVDRVAVRNCIAVMDQLFAHYGQECAAITGGLGPSQVEALTGWLRAFGVYLFSLDDESVTDALMAHEKWCKDTSQQVPHWHMTPLPDNVRRVLEIRQLTASASVKKLYAIDREASNHDRLHNLYNHHGARTGRPTGVGPQPTNLPKAGPDLLWDSSGFPCGLHHKFSPWTGENLERAKKTPWKPEATDFALQILATKDRATVEYYFGDALLAISGCVRGVFCAGPDHELISSDYTAIEAVVAAAIAGEQWRLDTFARGEDIYLVSIAKIKGVPMQVYLDYRTEQNQHHPDRQDGKIAELASGYGGWINAWRNFGAAGTDDEIKQKILGWRAASPNIVEMWGGQGRGFPGSYSYVAERFGLEGAMVNAIQYPGQVFSYRCISFYMRGDAVMMRLPSGRELTYHEPRLVPSERRAGEWAINYMTWNSNPKMGPFGWVPMNTYGGRIFENADQAIAHDIQRHGITLLMRAGYKIVLHVYDEDVAEVPKGFGSIEEFEALMSTMPAYAQGWPIKASGGWRGHRYRKG